MADKPEANKPEVNNDLENAQKRNAQLEAALREQSNENKKLAARCTALQNKVEALEAREARLTSDLARASEERLAMHGTLERDYVYTLKTRLRCNGIRYNVGDLLPFDANDPPEDCRGLVEGLHFEKTKVMRR